jgi:glycosyltransferase involved in cell wall biosynthesis
VPKVSIVIPSYNRAEFIPATLDSILAQTFKDFEVIFVDDGSSDNTEAILAHYASHDKRIKYIKQSNSERAVARNNGMKRAQGEYIALVDSDDLWYPNKLEKQLEIFEEHHDLVLCYASVNRIDFAGNRVRSAPRQHQGHSGYIFFDLLMRNFIPSVTPMFKREIFDLVGEQNTEFIPYEDWDFWLRISHQGKFFHIAEPLGDYRLHPGQSVKNVKAEHIEKVTLAVLRNNTQLDDAHLQKYLALTNTLEKQFIKIRDKAFAEAHLRLAYWYIVSDKLDIAQTHLKKSQDYSKKFFDYRWWGLKSAHGLSHIAPEPVKELLGAFH